MLLQKIALLVKLEKKILLDSGANVSVISDYSHVDTNTIPSCRRADKSSGVETADKTVMPITGDGIILGCGGVICDDASHSLVSQSQFMKVHDAVVISDSVGAVAYRRSDYVREGLKELNDKCCKQNHVLFTAHVNDDSLYEITSSHVSVANEPTVMIPPSPLGASEGMTAVDPVCVTVNWVPDAATVERHAVAIEAMTFGAFYFTAECPRLRDMVRFFHEAWDHPSMELMCKIINEKIFSNIPKELTAKAVRKHFPQCEACPAANMTQNPIPREASDRTFVSGEELMVDIKVWANNSKALKHRRAFECVDCYRSRNAIQNR